MASSDYDTYGRMHAKSIFLSEDGLRLHDDNDDSKTITLKGPASYQAGNADITLPDSSGALLNSSSDLDARNLHHANLLPSVAPADGDKFLMVDVSDSEAMKVVSGTQLKSYCSTTLSPGDIDNSNLFAPDVVDSAALAANAVTQTQLQDDAVTAAKIQNNAVTAAKIQIDAVTSDKLANDAVSTMKIADNAVTAAKMQIHDAQDIGAGLADEDSFLVNDQDDSNNVKRVTGSALKTFIGSTSFSAGDIDNSNLFAAGVVDNAALANDAVDSSKLAANAVNTAAIGDDQVTAAKVANDAISTGKIQNDAVTSDKLAAAVALDTSVEAPTFFVGNNQWKFELDGSNNLRVFYWNGTSWDDKGGWDSGA